MICNDTPQHGYVLKADHKDALDQLESRYSSQLRDADKAKLELQHQVDAITQKVIHNTCHFFFDLLQIRELELCCSKEEQLRAKADLHAEDSFNKLTSLQGDLVQSNQAKEEASHQLKLLESKVAYTYFHPPQHTRCKKCNSCTISS